MRKIRSAVVASDAMHAAVLPMPHLLGWPVVQHRLPKIFFGCLALLCLPHLSANAQTTNAALPTVSARNTPPLVGVTITGGIAIADPLTTTPGDAVRGRNIVGDRQVGMCLLCHTGAFPDTRFHGDLAPSLNGAGSRLTTGALRLRIVDSKQVNPQSIMPAYYQIDGLTRVDKNWIAKPILEAQQIEDVVAYLVTLK